MNCKNADIPGYYKVRQKIPYYHKEKLGRSQKTFGVVKYFLLTSMSRGLRPLPSSSFSVKPFTKLFAFEK
jgi:hypothetical protein